MEPQTHPAETSLSETTENTCKHCQDAARKTQPAPSCQTPSGPPFYQDPPGFSPARQAKAMARDRLVKPMLDAFPYFAGLSLAFGVLFTFCLYKNPCGITYPLFTAFACLMGILACRKLQVPIKKDSVFLLSVALLIGISACRTADRFLIRLDGIALVLLGCIFALHQFYDDSQWNIGRYFGAILLYLCHAAASLPFPFRHGREYLRNQDNHLVKQIPLLLAGFLAALPVLAALTALLGAADAIFSDLMNRIFQGILRPSTLLGLMLTTAFAALSLYCLICSCLLKGIPRENPAPKKGSPVSVIAGLSMICLIYILFSVIQIVYLFLGQGALPEGYTYSGYARQGFFQLLLVAFLNLVMVLCCLKFIRPHAVTRMLLTIICGCTYIMIASACWRMSLYVREYHLSYLRVLVLWFLALLAILMAGVTRLIWNRRFPLFSYCLVTVSVFYLALSWVRPDWVIGWDYVNHLEGETFSRKDFLYLYDLSLDGAPALDYLVQEKVPDDTFAQKDEIQQRLDFYYRANAWPAYYNLGPRNYNFSFAKAKKLFPGP